MISYIYNLFNLYEKPNFNKDCVYKIKRKHGNIGNIYIGKKDLYSNTRCSYDLEHGIQCSVTDGHMLPYMEKIYGLENVKNDLKAHFCVDCDINALIYCKPSSYDYKYYISSMVLKNDLHDNYKINIDHYVPPIAHYEKKDTKLTDQDYYYVYIDLLSYDKPTVKMISYNVELIKEQFNDKV